MCRDRDGVLLLADVKRRSKPVAKNGSASLWDIGDGVACLEFHSKMNALDAGTVAHDRQGDRHGDEARFKALVIYNEGEQLLGRRQYRPRALRRQPRRLGRDRGADRAGPEGHAVAARRALPALEIVTTGGARALNVPDHGVMPGCRADLVLLAYEARAEAVVSRGPRALVIKAGEVVARDGVCLVST